MGLPRRVRSGWVILLLAAAVLVLPLSASASGTHKSDLSTAAQGKDPSCAPFQHRFSNGDVHYHTIRVHQVRCASARQLMLKWSTSGGKIRVEGYSCAYQRTSHKVYALAVKCVKGTKWVHFHTLTT